tara:strand:- start:5582 stop:6358 length:777 start_codon:yes stop_codon:yes gene_type:complete
MLSIEYKSTGELIPYVNNSRTHSEQQIQQVAASIKEFGFTNPLLIDEDGGIIAGHGRLQAAQLLKLDEVPTITLAGLTEAQKKAYVIADNKLGLNAGWDETLLQVELNSLNESDFDISLLGFDKEEMLEILGENALDGLGDESYTKKVDIPTYEPKGDKPEVTELYDDAKTFDLVANIKDSNLPQAEKDFLMLAAGRHTVLNFESIANYYAHSSKECQELMEDSALVIIDFEKALELGYVTLSEKISEQYLKDYPDES